MKTKMKKESNKLISQIDLTQIYVCHFKQVKGQRKGILMENKGELKSKQKNAQTTTKVDITQT